MKRHCRGSEATKNPLSLRRMDCFAEPVIGAHSRDRLAFEMTAPQTELSWRV